MFPLVSAGAWPGKAGAEGAFHPPPCRENMGRVTEPIRGGTIGTAVHHVGRSSAPFRYCLCRQEREGG